MGPNLEDISQVSVENFRSTIPWQWRALDPQAGREQAGRRLAVVLSPRGYNEKARSRCCAPSRVVLRVRGVILADRLKRLDWRQRNAPKMGKLPAPAFAAVLENISALLQIQ